MADRWPKIPKTIQQPDRRQRQIEIARLASEKAMAELEARLHRDMLRLTWSMIGGRGNAQPGRTASRARMGSSEAVGWTFSPSTRTSCRPGWISMPWRAITPSPSSATTAVSGPSDPFRDRLLDGLATAITERGYRETTVADIARDEGKSSFDALPDIVCDDSLRTMFTRLPSAPSGDAWKATAPPSRTGTTLLRPAQSRPPPHLIAGIPRPGGRSARSMPSSGTCGVVVASSSASATATP